MEEFMVVRTREALQYRDSKDCKVSSARIEVRTGRKWKAGKAVEVAESHMRQKAMVGSVATGRGAWATSQRFQLARPVARKDSIYSRKRSEQAWRKSD